MISGTTKNRVICGAAAAVFGLVTTIGAVATADESTDQLVYGETTRLDTFDPYTIHEAAGIRLADLLFDALVELGPAGRSDPRAEPIARAEAGHRRIGVALVDLRAQVVAGFIGPEGRRGPQHQGLLVGQVE